MRKIITFLGLNPRETEYQWNGGMHKARVFPQVLRERLAGQYDQMLVFVTQEAKQKVLPILNPDEDPKLVPVDIPTPTGEADYWRLFECLTERVDEGDTVIFDITHGFRSIPFLVFLAAAYLKAAKGVTIEGIYYGALEMGQPAPVIDLGAVGRVRAITSQEALEMGRPAPVIDLSPFASLLDWLAATNQFIRTGSAADLAQVLRSGKPQGRSSVRRLADKLEGLSLALMLGYPLEAMRRADAFKRKLATVCEDESALPAPFRLLLGRLQKEYAARALAEPKGNVRENLRIQLDLLDWYVKNNQVIQAMALAREWVVSALAWKATGQLVLDEVERKEWERVVNGIARAKRGGSDEPVPEGTPLSHEQEQVVAELWDQLGKMRNDLAHAGMKPSPTKPEKIVGKAKEIQQQIRDLAERLGVCAPCPGDDPSPEDAA